jgi:hypothetical protein
LGLPKSIDPAQPQNKYYPQQNLTFNFHIFDSFIIDTDIESHFQ